VVINRYDANAEVQFGDVSAALGSEGLMCIPSDWQLVSACVNSGTLVVEQEPHSHVAAALEELERRLTGQAGTADSGLLARAMVWMATTPQCANEAFNITNGDLIRWEHTWPRIARYFNMEAGPRRRISIANAMADKGPVWDRIVQKYGLRPIGFQDIVRWPYGDFVFTPEYDIVSHLGKLRRFGFHETVDTEEMFFRLWDEMRAHKIIPPAD